MSVNNWCQLFSNNFSANKMQQIKQVEVRMDESHLEGRGDPPESTCSMVCDKIMKNMVLTLTILGKCFWHWRGAFTSYISAYFGLSYRGRQELLLTELLQEGGQTRSHPRTINLNCMFLGKWKTFPDPLLWAKTYKCHCTQKDKDQIVSLDVKVANIPARTRRCLH